MAMQGMSEVQCLLRVSDVVCCSSYSRYSVLVSTDICSTGRTEVRVQWLDCVV